MSVAASHKRKIWKSWTSFEESLCENFGMMGHFAGACRKKGKGKGERRRQGIQQRKKGKRQKAGEREVQANVRGPMCKTYTHVSYQQISILTLNFNTSFVGNLTNVASLEYFTLTVFSFVFVERCFSCLAWEHQTSHVAGSF